MGAALAALGAFAAWAAYDRVGPTSLRSTWTDETAAFWLGALLVAVGLGALLFSSDVAIEVDEARRLLFVRRKGLGERSERAIPFAELSSVDVARVGRARRGIVSHHLLIRLKDGGTIRTGRWSADRSEIEGQANRLAAATGASFQAEAVAPPADAAVFVGAFVASGLVYAAWYRWTVGPWCPAMWGGTAPPVIVSSAFLAFLRLGRWVRRAR